jgi:hypothetical protein
MFIKYIIEHIKILKIIKAVIKEENLLENLSNLFSKGNYKVNFKRDWIGRIYAVINPVVSDPGSRIFEYDTNGTNINSFVNKWVLEHMIAASNFVKNNGLFDILTYEIKQLDDDYNFLFILTPISWNDFKKGILKTLGCIASLAILIIGLFILL